MPFITSKCPRCGKLAESVKEFNVGQKTVLLLKCSHIIQKDQLGNKSPETIISLDGKKPFKYQCDGIKFAEKSAGRCLIGDEMRLGKTVQALGLLSLHSEMLPAIFIVKGKTIPQWQKEIMRWMGEDCFAQTITETKTTFLPGMTGYIMSYDIIRRFAPKDEKSEDDYQDKSFEELVSHLQSVKPKAPNRLLAIMDKLKIKTIILDECQQIKNVEAQRTVLVREMCAKVDYVIALSGSPIKNNASEFFPILNILKPEIFPRLSSFLLNDCDTYFDGYRNKTGGLRNPESFKKKTENFIIRRTRAEVMPDMPTIMRDYNFSDLSKEVEAQYNKLMNEFQEESYDGMTGFQKDSCVLGYINRMRHLTGLSKIDPCLDYIMEFLGSTDASRKIVIFTHHIDVREILSQRLTYLMSELGLRPPLRLSAENIDEFQTGEARVAIASTISDGEGLTLNKCEDAIILEREWNPANEEQAECRFPHVENTNKHVNVTYMIATGTVDELFTEVVERKREICKTTLDGAEGTIKWNETSLIRELGELLAAQGAKKWTV